MRVSISPSMMCADIFFLKETLEIMEKEKIDYLHMDIMDGHFVPNYMLGTDYVKRVREVTSIPIDFHMMVDDPDKGLPWFEFNEGDLVAVHAESTKHLQRTLSQIRERGARPVVAINPATSICMIQEVLCDVDGVLVMTVNPGFAGQKLVPQTLDKIRRLRSMLDELGKEDVFIEVDGNVSLENAKKMREAGADTFVVGTSCLFTGDNLADNIHTFRTHIK